MSDCPACAAAEADPFSGLQEADCPSCQARAIAQSPAAEAAWLPPPRNKFPTRCDLINALQRVFGAEWAQHEAAVRAWWDRMNNKRLAMAGEKGNR